MTPAPVSQALEAELLQEVHRQGILVWLDKDASYSAFVDRLVERHRAAAFPCPVVGFRGSFLETLFALEPYASGYDKHALIVHMPGYTEDSIRKTPLLELYEAGARFRKALETLIRQAAASRVLPEEIDAYLKQKPSLEQADAWLAQSLSRKAVGLEALLDSSGKALVVEALALEGGVLAVSVTSEADATTLGQYLHRLAGMDAEWLSFAPAEPHSTPLERMLSAFSAWILCVEYVHDLRREPHVAALRRLRGLAKPLVAVCTEIASRLRQGYPAAYVELADSVEAMLDVELEAMKPEDLGHIDTFREEENQMLRGAVDALKAQEWAKAADWARAREGEKSFWLGRDAERRRTWNLVAEAATFGTVLAQHPRPFETLHDFEDALTRYAESASQVDRAHRHFEQEWLRRLDTQMPHYGALQEVLGALRGLYRAWADALARDFTRLCTAEGFLPPLHLQQRTLYEAVVRPITHGGERIAIFLVDAFRYEMATELLDELKALAGGAVVDLKARLAELPTITSVGMNALAPASREGRLEVAGAFKGFRSGETLIKTPADRAKAMGMRTSGTAAAYLTLANVCESTPEALKSKLKEHQVAIVCSTDIDEAGESGLGLLTFEAQLRQLKAAWHHLQTAGFKHALFTADHGFLLQDSTTRVRPFGKKTDPHPRYVLDDHERRESGIVPIALSKLGYVGISGYLLVHEDTSVFATPASGASFVHGGNSPEERIIPVLTVTRKRAESSSLTDYAVEAEPMAAAFGFHRMRVRLTLPRQSQTSLGFAAARSIELDLRVPERRDIRVTLKEISGAGRLRSGRLHAPVGDEWSEVFFELVGPTDERVHVEIYHADNIERVRPCIPDARFAVSGLMGDGRSGSRAPSAPPPASSWAEAFEEEGVRRVFLHIEKHGAITEGEIIAILGNSRAARRFSLKFDEYLTKLPFRVRSEAGSSGKRYVREEEK